MRERIVVGLGIVGTGTGLASLLWLIAQLLK
jgi:hypothetical protein